MFNEWQVLNEQEKNSRFFNGAGKTEQKEEDIEVSRHL